MPHLIPTRAAASANNGEAHADAPDIDPQDRIDLVLAHLGTPALALQHDRRRLPRDVSAARDAPVLDRGSRCSALLFAAAIIYLPPLQSIFHTAALGPRELIVLACFPVIVWGSDELWRWRARRLGPTRVRHPEPAPAGAS
jgi:hypothetical protein